MYIYVHVYVCILYQRRPQILGWVDSMTGCRVLRANEIAINGSVL